MDYQYRAFLSYSHKDALFAERFHKSLESWRAGRGLAGRETPSGRVPANLRPVFRDRDDFSGGRTLALATTDALKRSQFLIVLCSPDAARSAYVNEEIRLFKTMGGSERIIPVIIDGEPGHRENDCFPPALVRRVGADGELTDAPDEILAADARDQGDGPRRALAKVIAGMLGLPFDEIVRRAERAQRQKMRLYAGVAVAMFCLALAAGVFGWLAETRRVTAERNYQAALDAADSLLGDVGEELIRTEGIRLETTRRLISRSESIYDQLIVSLPDSEVLPIRKATALAVFAKAYEAKGDRTAALETIDRALALTGDVAASAPEDDGVANLRALLQIRKGTLLAGMGETDTAIALMRPAVARLHEAAERAGDSASLAWEAATSARMLSLTLSLQDKFDEAKTQSERATEIATHWRRRNPDEMRWQMLSALSRIQTGMVQERAGRAEQALASYNDAQRILEQNVEDAPDIAQLRIMLVQVLDSTARLQEGSGDAGAAASTRRRAVEITRRLASADSENDNVRLQAAEQEVAAAVALLKRGDRAAAIPRLDAALSVLAEIAANNTSASHAGLLYRSALDDAARTLEGAGLYLAAESRARELLALREGEATTAPEDETARANLSRTLGLLAFALDGQDKLDAALDVRRHQLELEEVLTAGDPDRRRHLAWIRMHTGLLLWRLSRRQEAEPFYAGQALLLEELWRETPEDDALGANLGQAWLNLGELRALNRDPTQARAAFTRCLEIGETLLKGDPDDAERLIALAWAEARMAELGVTPASRWPRVEALLVRADRITPLGDQEDELLTVARISLAAAGRSP